MPGVFVTSPALCKHDTGLQPGIRGGDCSELLQLLTLTLGGVKVWKFCNHVAGQVHDQAWDPNPVADQVSIRDPTIFHRFIRSPGRIVDTTMQTLTLQFWTGTRRLLRMKSSSSCCTRNGARGTRSTMETTSGALSLKNCLSPLVFFSGTTSSGARWARCRSWVMW